MCFGRMDIRVLALAGLGLWCLCRLVFEESPGSREYVPLVISYSQKKMKLLALRDTGNSLRDPITGRQALVLCAGAASRLTGLSLEQIRDPLATMAEQPVPGLRILPYRTVGQGSSLMLAMVFEDVELDGRKQKTLVAFAPENFGAQEAYQALAGGICS